MSKLFTFLVVILLLTMVMVGCSSPASTPPAGSAPASSTAPPKTAPASTAAASTAPASSAAPSSTAIQPQYGGTFKVITTALPANIGYLPTMASDGQNRSSMWAERLMDVDINGDIVPCLAESWSTSPDGLSVTFNIRKGVKFQDGTDFNAEAARWNFQQALDAKALPDGQFVKSFDVVDPYTLKVTLNQPNSIMLYALWRPWMFSPTATQKNGKDWAVTHPVSTSAYKVTDYQRDVVIKMEKYADYWRSGRPYMDAIELRLVKDPATCSMIMQSGQADMWIQATQQESADLRDKGFQVLVGISRFNVIAPDSLNASSPFTNAKVRQAMEYSLDRPAIAKALGFGFSTAMDRLANPGSAGFDPNYQPRTYDVAKAKQLLSEAGYAGGIDTTMTLLPTSNNMGAVLQNYLSAVGIRAKLEVADSGKFYSAQQADGWKGLLLTVVAISPEYSVAFTHHFSKTPDVKFVSLAKSDAFYASVDKTLTAKDISSMRDATKQMIDQASSDALVVPINTEPVLNPVQKYVNTTFTRVYYWTGWKICDDWLGKK
jgi:peptide/nickel transport system substrate-binding protein